MPFKHNESRRHRIGRMNFKVTNRQECEAGLRRRGSLTLWLTLAAPLLRSGDRDSLDAWPGIRAASDRWLGGFGTVIDRAEIHRSRSHHAEPKGTDMASAVRATYSSSFQTSSQPLTLRCHQRHFDGPLFRLARHFRVDDDC